MGDNEGLTIALVFRRSRISVLKLRNLKDTTMPRPYYRLKVDLSKFFYDVRRICWIFIDLSKIQHIIHVKQHISKIFGIIEPFHLLLNDVEYLPSMEDVRILQENETIKVIPGSGINNDSSMLFTIPKTNSKYFSKTETPNNTTHDKVVRGSNINIDKIDKTEIRVNPCNKLNISDNTSNNSDSFTAFSVNNTRDMMFVTANGDTEEECKITDNSNLTEIDNTTDSAIKRKRIRKRKSKSSHHQESQIDIKQNSKLEISSSDTKEEDKSKKPKIVEDFIISTGKHIRFNDTEEIHIPKQIAHEVSHNNMKSYMNKGTSKNLSTLLGLRQSSTPITFTKKIKDTNKTESLKTPQVSVINDVDMESPIEEKAKCSKNLKKINNDNSIEKNDCTKEGNKSTQFYGNLLNVEAEKFPILSRKPRVGETIAFKTLKLSGDYTPQVSNIIIGKILNCSDSANYIFKIIKGLEEIEIPPGKFSLSEEDETVCQDKVSFSFSQIIEPRLIMS